MYVNLLNDYLKNKYGKKMYKISLNGGMTCPNRDGTISTGGCIFCSEGGSGDFASDRDLDITSQIEQGIERIKGKYKGNSYIAYFQAYTNTYATAEYLEKIYMEAVNYPDVEILSIATRPDCVDEKIAELLGRINKIKPVWIELGLQTANEESAKYINRGYDNAVFERAVSLLKKYEIEIIVHMIIGLPNEKISDMIKTVHYINRFPVDGIKLQLLYVLKETRLAQKYEEEGFKVYSLDEYLEILFELIRNLRTDIVIHRLTGDGPKKLLIAPKWTANKRYVMNMMRKRMSQENLVQGEKAEIQ